MDTKLNIIVELITFNGTTSSPDGCNRRENYWKLIGSTGRIVQDPEQSSIFADFSDEKRVLVQFERNVKSLDLHCHNNIENSLWILVGDLEIIE